MEGPLANESAVLVGRLLLDSMFSEPLHDGYSLILGIHIMIGSHSAYRLAHRYYRRYQRHRRSMPAEAAEFTSTLTFHPTNINLPFFLLSSTSLVVLGGFFCPLLAGAVFHVYVLLPFDGFPNHKPIFSVTSCWAYGVALSGIALGLETITRRERVNAMLASVSVFFRLSYLS